MNEEELLALLDIIYDRETGAQMFEASAAALSGTVNVPSDADVDTECICKGNWRLIVKEVEHLIGKKYQDNKGDEYTFYGVVHGEDDYYYGMWREDNCRLLSCVGSIEGHGFNLLYAAPQSAKGEK